MDERIRRAATVLIRDYIRMKRGENVLVYADAGSDESVVQATVDAVEARGGNPVEVWYRIKGPPGTEPPAPMEAAMKSADVLIEYARTYLITTKAFERAMDAGARHLCLTAMDGDMMIRCIGNVSLPAMKAFGNALLRMTIGAKDVRVTSSAGTDVRFSIGKRPVLLDTGECVVPGRDCYLGGQISWAAIERTIEGTVVLDGTVWPPDETAPLKEPIRVDLRHGRITSIEGGGSADILSQWFKHFRDKRMYNVAHFCYGFNPGARISGRILEDERAFGVFVPGFGSQMASFKGGFTLAKSHVDGVMRSPTVVVDGEEIERDGRFVHP
ncbi:MAG TPA: aminopeptidase, partial [Thermoplasmata archaeon]|nr:aminopeptidase [Thermoplasmata archaeon]